MARKGAAKYYVVFGSGSWKVLVSEPYTSGEGSTTLRTFRTKAEAVEYGKQVARNNRQAVMVNYMDGRTGEQYYDYSK